MFRDQEDEEEPATVAEKSKEIKYLGSQVKKASQERSDPSLKAAVRTVK